MSGGIKDGGENLCVPLEKVTGREVRLQRKVCYRVVPETCPINPLLIDSVGHDYVKWLLILAIYE